MDSPLYSRFFRIKNTFHPDGAGTIIQPDDDYEAMVRVPLPEHHDPPSQPPTTRAAPQKIITATACTLKNDVLVINVHSNRKSVSHGFFAKIFTILDRYGIVVDLISTSEVHVSLVVSASSLGISGNGGGHAGLSPMNSNGVLNVEGSSSSTTSPTGSPRCSSANGNGNFTSKLDLVLRDLRPLGEVSVVRNMSILSLVGKQMRNMVGIAGKMFSILARENVNLEIISQGASEINISCVVRNDEAERGLRAIHDVCVLGDSIA